MDKRPRIGIVVLLQKQICMKDFSIDCKISTKLMARSHWTGTGQVQVQGMGLAQWETMGVVSFQVLMQCEQFCIIYTQVGFSLKFCLDALQKVFTLVLPY